jgi:hypothetical protein
MIILSISVSQWSIILSRMSKKSDFEARVIQDRWNSNLDFRIGSSQRMMFSSRWDVTISSQLWAQAASQWYNSGQWYRFTRGGLGRIIVQCFWRITACGLAILIRIVSGRTSSCRFHLFTLNFSACWVVDGGFTFWSSTFTTTTPGRERFRLSRMNPRPSKCWYDRVGLDTYDVVGRQHPDHRKMACALSHPSGCRLAGKFKLGGFKFSEGLPLKSEAVLFLNPWLAKGLCSSKAKWSPYSYSKCL